MTFSLEEIAFYSFLVFAIGAILSYFIVNLIKVDKRKYERLRSDLGLTQNDLDTQKALVSQFANDKHTLEERLAAESQTNRMQATEIAALGVKYENINLQYQSEKEVNNQQQSDLNAQRQSIANLKESLTRQDAQNTTLLEKLDTQKDEILQMRRESEQHFENIANRLLEEKTQRFSETNQKNMKQILDPLNQKIKEFETKVESTNKESIDRHSQRRRVRNTSLRKNR